MTHTQVISAMETLLWGKESEGKHSGSLWEGKFSPRLEGDEFGLQLSRGRVFQREATAYVGLAGAEDSKETVWLERIERGGEQEKMTPARWLEGCIVRLYSIGNCKSLSSFCTSEQKNNMSWFLFSPNHSDCWIKVGHMVQVIMGFQVQVLTFLFIIKLSIDLEKKNGLFIRRIYSCLRTNKSFKSHLENLDFYLLYSTSLFENWCKVVHFLKIHAQ